MSRPRKRAAADEGGEVVVEVAVSQQGSSKRCCGSAQHPAPGEVSTEEAASYLHAISSHLGPSELHNANSVLNTHGWQSLAELNLLLQRCLSSDVLPSTLLRGYHSFVVQPRDRLWASFSAAATQRGAASAAQLQLLHFLLHSVLSPWPHAAVTELRLQLPGWMVSWASRWGFASSQHSLTLIMLEAYPPPDPSSSANSGRREAAQRLFVPALL